jgi:glucose/arabinose dehydrogenase
MSRVLGSILATLAIASCASAATESTQLGLRTVVTGLDAPLYVTSAPGQPNNLYVVEQPGVIRVVVNGKLRARPFLDIRRLVRSGGEQGLLSVAFHPKYRTNHRFYVDYTDVNGDTRVMEYKSNGTVATRRLRQLLFVDQPYPNHNGGQLQFGPDGLLYVGMGDGGSGGDPQNNGQTLSSRLGKLLTINVNSRSVSVAVAGYGLRNPWRFSFDKAGNLYLADVGQDEWEEIDYTPRNSPGLENYGWNVYEGTHVYSQDKTPNDAGHLVMPVAEYSHSLGCSVTGGYVWNGRYYYGDFCSGIVWSLRIAGGKATGIRRESIKVPSLSSWGLDGRGNLYATSLEGTVFRVSG